MMPKLRRITIPLHQSTSLDEHHVEHHVEHLVMIYIAPCARRWCAALRVDFCQYRFPGLLELSGPQRSTILNWVPSGRRLQYDGTGLSLTTEQNVLATDPPPADLDARPRDRAAQIETSRVPGLERDSGTEKSKQIAGHERERQHVVCAPAAHIAQPISFEMEGPCACFLFMMSSYTPEAGDLNFCEPQRVGAPVTPPDRMPRPAAFI